MAPFSFDANGTREKRQFTFTCGKSRETARWTDARRFTFQQLADYMRNSPEVGQKDGTCYTPALFRGYRRDLQQSTQIDVVVLDSDCGHALEFIRAAVAAKGWRAIIHSTHSHLSTETTLKASAYRKWQEENPDKTVGDYMIAKKGFLADVMRDAYVADEVSNGNSSDIVVRHAPCPKFRILLPLHRSWLADDYASQDIANATWRERIGALAYALGLYHDQSCVDTSRLFYFPRVRDDAAQAAYQCVVLDGEDCDLWGLPDARPAGSSQPATILPGLFDAANVVRLPAREVPREPIDKKYYVNKETGEIYDLTLWAARYAGRFEIVKAITARSPKILAPRKQGVKAHIYCVRSGDHMTGGTEGTGTFIVNASDLSRANMPSHTSGFVVHCMHNGCVGVDRLEHIREMLAQGALTVDDLTNPDFLSGEAIKVDVSKLVEKAVKVSEVVKFNAPQYNIDAEDTNTEGGKENATNILPYLYEGLPGVLGIMHDYIVQTAPKPQPVLTLGTILTFAASVVGQRVKLQNFGLRPNMYILGLGVSGSGKDWPLKACKKFAQMSGLYDELIGIEEVASDSSIVTAAAEHPRQLINIDEIGFLLNAVNDPRSGQHIKGVVSTLLRLYSSSADKFRGKSYADSKNNKSINQPCISLFGLTTPRGFTDSLSAKDIESGLLSRMVVFDAGLNDPLGRVPQQLPIPEEILQWIQAWQAVKPIQNIVAMQGGDAVIEPREVMMTEEALRIAEDFEYEMHELKQKARLRGKDALYVRARENALKFALVRACAVLPVMNANGTGMVVDESALRVDATTMRWAVDLSRATVMRMDSATDEIADTPYEQQMKAMRIAILRAGPRGMSATDLARSPAGRMALRQRDELLNTLIEAGEIKQIELKHTGKGRPRKPYIHKKFFGMYGVSGPDDDNDSERMMAGE